MQLKKIRGNDMRDALFRVRSELGPEAMILHTRSGRTRGILGLWGRPYVEIVASMDAELLTYNAVPEHAVEGQSAVSPVGIHGILNKHERGAQGDLAVLQEDISWIKSMLGKLARRDERYSGSEMPEPLSQIYLYLREQEMAEELAAEIVRRIREDAASDGGVEPSVLRSRLRQCLEATVAQCEPIALKPGACVRCALIGPTGVGKTTTIAKLAADFALIKKKRVSVITVDTYRIAAVEQIRTYMDIIGIPLEVVTTPQEMRAAVAKHSACDLVLIDTAGRSQKNGAQLAELKSFIDAAAPDEVHLVLSTTGHYRNTLDIIEKFSGVRVNKLLFTKLDEAVNFGLIFSVAARVGKALSYLTTGQSVPDDIRPADFKHLAQVLLEKYQ